jgi:hypothetical protein
MQREYDTYMWLDAFRRKLNSDFKKAGIEENDEGGDFKYDILDIL